MQKLVSFYLFLSLFACATQEPKKETENYSVDFQKNKGSEEAGRLIIKFISDEIVEYENVELKITNEFPRTKYVTNWVSFSPIPLILPIGEKPDKPTIHYPMFTNKFLSVQTNGELQIRLEEGEYYLALESDQKGFHFSLNEAQDFYFKFGFTNEKKRGKEFGEIREFNGDCISGVGGLGNINYASCRKIKILKGKNTYINVSLSDSKPTSFGSILFMIYPGILLLAPFNYLGSYSYREMKVELISPKE